MSSMFSYRKVYGAPLALACVTIAGLLSALFGDGMWDVLSWITLAVPLGVIAQKLWRAKRGLT